VLPPTTTNPVEVADDAARGQNEETGGENEEEGGVLLLRGAGGRGDEEG
jgi:hypothetical protein